MSRVDHRNVCKLVDSFISNGSKLNMIMEYCDRGDLDQYLKRAKEMSQSFFTATPSSNDFISPSRKGSENLTNQM